jgi:hypothetical protein
MPERTPETYGLYVDNTLYLQDNAEIYGTNLSLTGKYMGSGTRIGENGTVFFTNEVDGVRQITDKFGKQIKIMHNDNILYDFYVTGDEFCRCDDDMNHSVNIANGVTIYLHDLHRFDSYPYEISGVKFPTPQVK